MRILSLHTVKSIVLAASLLATASASAANVIGEPVTEFTNPEQMKLNWPYKLAGSVRALLRTELLTFRVDAPKAGKYAVEYLVNATGNNVQLAATASKSVTADDVEPDFNVFAHITTVTDEDLPEPVEAEDVEPYVPAEPVYMYSVHHLALP